MKTKPDLKFGDRVVFIGDGQKRGVVSRVFRSGGLWWLALKVTRTGDTRQLTSGAWLKAAASPSKFVNVSSWLDGNAARRASGCKTRFS
jgi:hypothetical protein